MAVGAYGPDAERRPTSAHHFGAWLNEHRPHGALHSLTPQEAWEGRVLPEPVPIRARDQLQPQIEIRRGHYYGDLCLSVLDISVRLVA